MVLALTWLLHCATAPLRAPENWVAAAARIAPAIERLDVYTSQYQQAGTCTMVVINEEQSYALTAAHCLPERDDVTLLSHRAPVEIVTVSRSLDLALVRVPFTSGQADWMYRPAVGVGTPIGAVGFAIGTERPKWSFGHVSDARGLAFWPRVPYASFVTDAEVLHGMSGGAMFDTSGRLRSIIQAGTTSGGTLSMGIDPGRLDGFARAYWPQPPQES